MKPASAIYRAGTLTYTRQTLAVLFFWLLWGDFCFVLMENIIPSLVPLHLQALGAPNTLIALTIGTVPGMINAVFNPIISFKSDRYRSRWGRRIPFIMFSLPFLVLCLIGLAFSDQAGTWFHSHLSGQLGRLSPDTVVLIIIGILVTLFSVFNTFVNSVYWYLFNDVVPEHLMARFMSLFRLASMGSSAVYNLEVFKYAGAYSKGILIGVALLYLTGIGMMCLRVKEGEYPPAPKNSDGGEGPLSSLKTYARECMSFPIYWYLFAINMALFCVFATSLFGIFFYKSRGLTYEMMGQLMFATGLGGAIMIPVSGWLADRYHPIRIVKIGLILQVIVAPINLVWLYWDPSPLVFFHVNFLLNLLVYSPVNTLIWIMDPPLFMRIFPRERYGQFCSANSLCRSVAMIMGGAVLGVCLDQLTARFGSRTAYSLLPFWNTIFFSIALIFILKLYRAWKRLGGDDSYIAPLTSSSSIVINSNLEPISIVAESTK